MGLLNTTTTPAFEAESETSAAAVFANAPQADASIALPVTPAAAAAAAPAAAPVVATVTPEALAAAMAMIAASNAAAAAAAAPAVTAVAVVAPNANALTIAAPAYAISEGMKNAMVVDFNTFPQITTTNGNFVERESKSVLGDTVTFELLSFQDSFVVDPGDDKAPKELVRYSDDGAVCSDGTPVHEHLAFLRAGGYLKANLKKRSVVVGEITSVSKNGPKFVGDLVQFDLSPMSRTEWTRYLANSVNALRKGRKTEDELKVIVASAELATNGDNTYTKAKFASA